MSNKTKTKAPRALLTGAANIQKAVDSIGRRGARLDDEIQHAGLSILAHVEAHSDTTLADRLFNAMPKGSRREMLAEWFFAFGKMRALSKADAAESERLKAGHHFKYDSARGTDMEGAAAKHWNTMRKQAAAADAFDAGKAVAAVLARLQSASTKGLSIQGRAEALAHLRELQAALGDE